MQQRRVPERRCVGCNEKKPKKELVRIVRSPEGELSLDPTERKPGRGAYICRSADCLRLARKKRRLESSFKCAVPDGIYDALEESLAKEMAENE